MNNFDHAISATETAMNSAGSASRENERAMESLSAKLNKLKSTFQDLSNNVLTSETVKTVLDLANGFLTLVNTPVGNFVTKVALLTTGLFALEEVIRTLSLSKGIISQFKAFSDIIKILTGNVKGATTATVTFSTVTKAALPILGLITTAVFALSAAFDAVTVSIEEQEEKVEDLSGKLDNLKSEYDALTAKESLTEEDNRRLQILEAQILANEKLLDQEAQKLYYKQFGEGSKGFVNVAVNQGIGTAFTTDLDDLQYTGTENLTRDIEKYGELQKQIKDLEEKIISVDKTSSGWEHQIIALTDAKKKLEEESSDLASEINETGNSIQDTTRNMKEMPKEAREAIQAFEDWLVVYSGLEETVNNTNQAFDASSISLSNFSGVSETLATELGALQEQYDLVYEASEQYNKTGEISAEQLNELISLNGEYEGLIEIVNGKLKINAEKLQEAAIKAKEKALRDIDVASAQQLQAIALHGVAEAEKASGDEAKTAEENGLSIYLQALKDINKEGVTTQGVILGINTALSTKDPHNFMGLTDAQEEAMEKVIELNKKLKQSFSSVDTSLEYSKTSDKTRTKKEKDPIEEKAKAFKELNKAMEHSIKVQERQKGKEQETIALNRKYQQQLHEQAEWFRSQGVEEESKYIQELQDQWWQLENNINNINEKLFSDRLQVSKDYIDDRNYYNDWGADSEIEAWKRVLDWMENDYYKKGLISAETYAKNRIEINKKIYAAEKEAAKQSLQTKIEAYQKSQEKYEALFRYMNKQIDKEIKMLEKRKEDEEQYWDDKIDALKAENAEIERQIELEKLQDSLARARQSKVMVYKDGRYQYVQDIDQVNEATVALEKYQREEALRQETERLEKLKEEALEAIEDEIKGWEEWKEKWSEAVDSYGDEQDRLLAEQAAGIKLEGDNWKTRLDNLEDYVAKYKALMKEMVDAQSSLEAMESTPSYAGGQGGKGPDAVVGGGKKPSSSKKPSTGMSAGSVVGGIVGGPAGSIVGGVVGNVVGNIIDKVTGSKRHAKGTLSSPGGISLVGEKGAELRVLNQGDGVLPSDITKNLWQWGMTTPSDMMANLSGFEANRNEGTVISINNFSPNLPNVENGADFVQYITQDFVREVVQFSGKR